MISSVSFEVSVRDLRADEVDALTWAGPASHRRAVHSALVRRDSGELDYLAACGPADVPLAIGGVEYDRRPGAGSLWQLAVMPALQSAGIGTVLIAALEARVTARGLARVDLGVGPDNLRARALYERLGYVAFGSALDRWSEELDDGTTQVHEAHCVLLGKGL